MVTLVACTLFLLARTLSRTMWGGGAGRRDLARTVLTGVWYRPAGQFPQREETKTGLWGEERRPEERRALHAGPRVPRENLQASRGDVLIQDGETTLSVHPLVCSSIPTSACWHVPCASRSQGALMGPQRDAPRWPLRSAECGEAISDAHREGSLAKLNFFLPTLIFLKKILLL